MRPEYLIALYRALAEGALAVASGIFTGDTDTNAMTRCVDHVVAALVGFDPVGSRAVVVAAGAAVAGRDRERWVAIATAASDRVVAIRQAEDARVARTRAAHATVAAMRARRR